MRDPPIELVSYLELLAGQGDGAEDHEVLVSLQIDAARPVAYEPLPSEKPQDRQHAFRVRVESEGELYVRVNKGVQAFGGFLLGEDYNAVVNVPALQREVQIEGQGGLLALNGERKLSIRSRGLSAIEYEIARVATTQINHLVSQTEGQFQHPHFQFSELFNEEGPAVGGFFDDLRCRFAGAVSGFGFDPDQSWFVATLRGLKRGGEFKTVRGHHAIVVIGSRDHGRRITAAFGDVMKR